MTMLHDMSLTDRYAIVYDQPCTVDFDLAFAGRFPFVWNPDYGNRVGLLPRQVDGRDGEAGDIIWIDVPIGYAFHPMNAYDTADGRVVIDLCNYDVMFDRDILGPFGDPAAGAARALGARSRPPDGIHHRRSTRVPTSSRAIAAR